MKKIFCFLFVLICTNQLFAKSVSTDEAKQIGYNFLQQKLGSSVLTSIDAIKLEYTSVGETGVNCFYVFNGATGFVMVSADDIANPILAYSTERKFDRNNIPTNTLYFIGCYAKQIDFAVATNVSAQPETVQEWNNLRNNVKEKSGAKTTVVSPLLTTTWNQNPYYNDSCPYDAPHGGRSVVGCVATATAQVMKFWNWPAQGTGTHTYTSSFGPLTANYGSTTYNWASMPNSISSHNTAIAQLSYHVGVAVNMSYSATGSGAYVISSATGSPPYCAEYALKTYFKYATSLHGYARSSYTDAAWISMIETDLNAGRPVIYAGAGSAGGHCWVTDGYDASNKLHCNWGWGGYGPDGYYAINAMNPPSLGTGGGGGGFNSNQMVIVGIKPNVSPITGTLTVCQGSTTTLSNATTPGTWSSGSPLVASVSSTGVVSGLTVGTAVISYSTGGSFVTATVTVNPMPNAGTISGGAVSMCLSQTHTLYDAAIGGTWSSGSPSVATVSTSGVVSAVGGGVVTINYSVSNSCGTAVASTTLTINSAPPITAAPTVPLPGTTPCSGSPITLTATCAGASSFVWTVTGTGWSGSSSTAILSATVGTGVGQIIVSGSNACGAGPSDTINITPNTLPSVPSISIAGPMPCTGATTATYNATSTGATTYIWTIIGTGWSGSSTTNTITLTLGSGLATLICTAVNSCGNSRQDTLIVSPSPLPQTPTVSLSSAFPCVGTSSAICTATAMGATSFTWTVLGTGWSGSSTTNTINVTIGTGSGIIICAGVNSCGAGTSDTFNLTPAPPVGAAGSITPTSSLCSGNLTSFITPSITGATSYLWTVSGTGWSGTSTTNVLTATVGTGIGTVTVEGVGPCGTGTPTTVTSLIPTITANPSFSLSSHLVNTGVNDILTYTGTIIPGAYYTWNFDGAVATPGIGVGPHLLTWNTAGIKNITLTVTDSGCTSVIFLDNVTVVVPIGIENGINGNNDVVILPNPSNGIFEASFNKAVNKQISVKISDMQGRVVYSTIFEGTVNNNVKIDVSWLPASVYTATIVTDGIATNKKVVIRK